MKGFVLPSLWLCLWQAVAEEQANPTPYPPPGICGLCGGRGTRGVANLSTGKVAVQQCSDCEGTGKRA